MAEIGQAGSAAAGLEAREEDGVLVLRLSGELDVTNAEQVRSAVDAVLSSETERLIFDLEGLRFMDSSGIAMLVSVAHKVREVQVRNPSTIVRRLIELTGLADALHVTPSGPVSLPAVPGHLRPAVWDASCVRSPFGRAVQRDAQRRPLPSATRFQQLSADDRQPDGDR